MRFGTVLTLTFFIATAGCIQTGDDSPLQDDWDEADRRCWEEGDCTYERCIKVELQDCRYYACIEAESIGTIESFETDLALPAFAGKEEVEIPSEIDCATLHVSVEGIHPLDNWVSLKREDGFETDRCTVSSKIPANTSCAGEGIYPGVYTLEWHIRGASSAAIRLEGLSRPET